MAQTEKKPFPPQSQSENQIAQDLIQRILKSKNEKAFTGGGFAGTQ